MNWINLCTSSTVIEDSNATTEGLFGRNYPTIRDYQFKFPKCPSFIFIIIFLLVSHSPEETITELT